MGEMVRRGITPNLVCFNTVLHACAHSGDAGRALHWLEKISAAGVEPNKITFNSMVDAYAKAGDAALAELWLRHMIGKGFHPDSITYATLLRACHDTGKDDGHHPNSDAAARWSYNAIVKAYSHAGNVSGMKRWLGEMSREGFKPTEGLRDDIIRIALGKGDPKFAGQVDALISNTTFIKERPVKAHAVAQKQNSDLNHATYNFQPSQRSSHNQVPQMPLPVGLVVPKRAPMPPSNKRLSFGNARFRGNESSENLQDEFNQ
jgi:pentatricopeptide repeat protein